MSSNQHTYSVKVGSVTLTFHNVNGYQDVSVIRAVSEVIGKSCYNPFYTPFWPHLLRERQSALGKKMRVLARFGTRLLIRVELRLLAEIIEDQEYFCEEKHALFMFINDVLKLRAHKPRHMRAFIDYEYNPESKSILHFYRM